MGLSNGLGEMKGIVHLVHGFILVCFRLTQFPIQVDSKKKKTGSLPVRVLLAIGSLQGSKTQVIRRGIARCIFLSTVFLRRFWLGVSVLVQKPTWHSAAAPSAK